MTFREAIKIYNSSCGFNKKPNEVVCNNLSAAKKRVRSCWVNSMFGFLHSDYDPETNFIDLWYSPHPINDADR